MPNLNKHVISITMEDVDIPTDNITIAVFTEEPLQKVEDEIRRIFRDYDLNEEPAEPYRENGWGLESFIDFLRAEKRGVWVVCIEYPDAHLKLVGG